MTTSSADPSDLPRTQRELKAFLARHGIRPRRRLGQNFMVDGNLIHLMIREAEVGPEDRVLEIGTGTGLLTAPLAEVAAHVVTVEADLRLFEATRSCLDRMPGVRRIAGDVLDGKHRLSDEVRETMIRWGAGAYKVVANLPYQVAVPFLLLVLESEAPPERIVVTVQREVADRLLAGPDSPHYGRVSVEAYLRARTRRLRNLGPEVFWPRPQVESSLIEMVPIDANTHLPRSDHAAFRRFVATVFGQRRKQMTAVGKAGSERRAALRRGLVQCGIDPGARGEQLTPEQLVAVFRAWSAMDLADPDSA